MYSVRSKYLQLDMKFEIKGFVFNGGVYNFLNNEINYVI